MQNASTLRASFVTTAVSLLCIAGFVNHAGAQFVDLIGGQQGGESADPEVTAKLVLDSGDVAVLAIKVKLPPGSHTYSTNPPFAGRTKIQIKSSKGLTAVEDKFTSDPKPEVRSVEFLGRVEEHYESVTWKRKYRIEAGSESVSIDGILDYQVCDERSCRPLKTPFKAVLAIQQSGSTTKPVANAAQDFERHPFQHKGAHKSRSKGQPPIGFEFQLSPENAGAGDEVTFKVTATLNPQYHTFPLKHYPDNVGRPTRFLIENHTGLDPLDEEFRADREPEAHSGDDGKTQYAYYKTVTWSRRFRVSPKAESASYGLKGMVVYQICTEKFCIPGKISFALGTIDPAAVSVELPGSPTTTKNPQAADSEQAECIVLEKIEGFDDGSIGGSSAGLGTYILFAFLGGFILNFMPCVLPVIAIKALSFVQQADESRERLMALNLTYSAGVISVFVALASLAAFAKLGWGGLFQSVEFNITMACIVFAMALSLLGIFEIPVPGMVGSAAGSQHQEGLFGAFMTGIFATLLATPCSGPFLGTTLGWSVKQPPGVIYLVWSVMGLGMASPYIVFSFFPAAIRSLPRPGNWMVHFKEFCGIVLLGTVLFIVSFMHESYTIPVLVMLLGIGLGLWMLGKLYDINSSFNRKMVIRFSAVAVACGIGYFGYGLRNPGVQLPWEEFANNRIDEAVHKEHKTVLIDFTADWCLSCKTVEKLALNTEPTLKMVRDHEVVVIRADWTDGSPEVKKWLDKFDSVSIPVTAIIPAHRPERPIVLRDLYSQAMLLKSLKRAVELPAESKNQSARAEETGRRSL